MNSKSDFKIREIFINNISKKMKLDSLERDILFFVMPSQSDIEKYANHTKDENLDNVNEFGLYVDLPFNEKQQYINFLSFAGYDAVSFGCDNRFPSGGHYAGLGFLQRSLYYLCVKINSQL